jgi:two-component system, cell cycle sensor histidine kinase and response regulator CckA
MLPPVLLQVRVFAMPEPGQTRLAQPAFDGTFRTVFEALPDPGYLLDAAGLVVACNPATLAQICEPFYSTRGTGRGLGLAAMVGIMRSQGGALQVESQPGSGSTLTACLPAPMQPAPATAAQAPAHTERPAQEDGRQRAVLVIDDEPPVREALSDLLEMKGYQVLTAADGAAGVTLYDRHHRDLFAVILDLLMPGMDGAATYRNLHRIDPEVPVILSSGYDEIEAFSRFSASDIARPNSYLQKPYRIDTLLAKLNECGPHDR